MNAHERRLRLPGKLEQVQAACDFVIKAAKAADFDDEGIFQIQLSVEEIFTNIVEHGYGSDGDDKSIDIIANITDKSLFISILDEAPPFNPLLIQAPDPEASLWERQVGGWGIYFVRQYMDDVQYQLDNNRNRITLEKKRPS